ncbi:MAG: hypothetical protein ACI4BC_05450 [Muribaculaceae bacterium]
MGRVVALRLSSAAYAARVARRAMPCIAWRTLRCAGVAASSRRCAA